MFFISVRAVSSSLSISDSTVLACLRAPSCISVGALATFSLSSARPCCASASGPLSTVAICSSVMPSSAMTASMSS
ncbi:MAG: hypothetical protein IPN95_25905 [Bacteroidetes bacterium]|nr:hypothetical protein [Bacteroidota bacterium]